MLYVLLLAKEQSLIKLMRQGMKEEEDAHLHTRLQVDV